MATFLMKTEPGEYSFDDLVNDKRTVWSGVTNAAALGHIRAIRKGDEVLIYHTGGEKAIVGLARAAGSAYADPKKPGTTPRGEPKFAVVDLVPVRSVSRPVTLAQVKADPRFKEFALVRQSRLSVMPVPPAMDTAIRTLAGLK
jgi:predicted RNA-binding protein with PUA-like domain